MNVSLIIDEAFKAREKSHSPYSGFKVGAALLTDDGRVYRGANIENAAYGSSICAERVAFFTALLDGYRNFISMAVVGGFDDKVMEYCYPCGSCRQVMREFCSPSKFKLIIAKNNIEYREHFLGDLLPYSFGPENLK